MSWKLFLDDERLPVDDTYIVAKNVRESIDLIYTKGCPSSIAFDHDLGVFNGRPETSIELIHWLINRELDHPGFIPGDFHYTVHSQNPIGAENIKSLLNCFLFYLKEARKKLELNSHNPANYKLSCIQHSLAL